MTKRNSFARIGALSVALLIALGAMGTAYGVWSETLSITATVDAGDWGVAVTGGDCSDPDVISCYGSGEELTVMLTDAPDNSYWCEFDVENTGSIPIKIQNITESSLPTGVTIDIIEDVDEGTQIDSGITETGRVNFTVAVGVGQVANGSFTLTFDEVPWNQYVP